MNSIRRKIMALSLFFTCSGIALANDYYISNGGSDANNGSSAYPFKTVPHALSMAVGGDTIIIKSGTYNQDDIGRIWDFNGSSSSKITVRGEYTDHYSVTLEGFYVVKGDGADIRYIKFFSAGIAPGATVGIISIGANYISLSDCFITGQDEDYGSSIDKFDGIKILGRTYNDYSIRAQGITVSHCLIKNCPEDAIDNTGAKDVYYLDNIITRCGQMQIKGGSENVYIERNKIYKTSMLGITTGGMDTVGVYTGNPELPYVTPVFDRFGGKNINIINNVMFDIKNEFVKPGWKNVNIINNTFDSQSVIKTGIALVESSMKYYDATALASGLEYDSGTDSGGDYVKIKHPTENVTFKNNIIYDHNTANAKMFYSASENFMTGFVGENNLYHSNTGGSATFRIEPTSMWGVANFKSSLDEPYENSASIALENASPEFWNIDNNDYRLVVDSDIANAGVATSNTLDYNGMPRGAYPSVGAYELKKEVLHLKFDGDCFDSSSFYNNATLINSPSYVRGFCGKAIDLNGSDQYITIPDDDSLDFTDQLTLSAWIKMDVGGNYDMIIGKSNAYLLAVDSSNHLYFNIHNGSNWSGAAYSISTITAGIWTHVAATYSKSAGEVKIYINGKLDNTQNISSPFSISTNNYVVELGRTWSNWFFDGCIDDIKMYNICLNEQQISNSLINESTVLWIKCGQDTGNLNDSSGNANNGTLQGGAGYGAGYYKSGIALSGNSSDYVSIDDNSTLRVGEQLTLSAWIKMDSEENCDMIVGKNNAYLLAVDSSNHLYFNIHNGSSWSGAAYSISTITAGIWTHVAATYSKSAGEVKIYINGKLDKTQNISAPFIINASTNNLDIGRMNGWNYWAFGGCIDDVRINNCTMNGLEVCRIMLDQ